MNQYLSISELSKLLDISVHNIRYYEKEGLLSTPKKTESGYRQFTYKDIDMLSAIMLLRASEIPIKKIKALLAEYTPDTVVEYMKQSSQSIEAEIQRLRRVKADIDGIVESSRFRELGIFKKAIGERVILPIKTCPHDEDLTERELFEFYMEKKRGLKNRNTVEFICIVHDKTLTYCLQVDPEDDGKKVPEGFYLCNRFCVNSEADYDREAETFLTYIKKNKIKVKGDLFLKEISLESLFYESAEKDIYEYQIRLK